MPPLSRACSSLNELGNFVCQVTYVLMKIYNFSIRSSHHVVSKAYFDSVLFCHSQFILLWTKSVFFGDFTIHRLYPLWARSVSLVILVVLPFGVYTFADQEFRFCL